MGEPYVGIPMKVKSTRPKDMKCCVTRQSAEGRVTLVGRVTIAGPMGLSITRPESRSITKILRWYDVQDMLIRKD